MRRSYTRSTAAAETTGVQRKHGKTYLGEEYETVTPDVTADAEAHTRSDSREPPRVSVAGLNHISVESADSDSLAQWYAEVLGFVRLPRPPFPFGGAWLQAAAVTLHIIDRDPEFQHSQEALAEARHKNKTAARADKHRFIRRGHHTALSVPSAATAEAALLARGLSFTKFTVPSTNLTQLFLFDPDGNGIELVGPL